MDLILEYATKSSGIDNPEAYREVIRVTGKSLGTVRNWLSYRVNLPDMASMARIVQHWNIPPGALYPPHLGSLLAGQRPAPPSKAELAVASDETPEQLLISPYGVTDASNLDRAFSKYTERPRSAIWVRHDGSEVVDKVRPGELMLVDASCESLRDSGLYLLRFSVAGQAPKTSVRIVEMLMAEPAVRISSGTATATSAETLPLVNGTLPPHISVLGYVVGILRQT